MPKPPEYPEHNEPADKKDSRENELKSVEYKLGRAIHFTALYAKEKIDDANGNGAKIDAVGTWVNSAINKWNTTFTEKEREILKKDPKYTKQIDILTFCDNRISMSEICHYGFEIDANNRFIPSHSVG